MPPSNGTGQQSPKMESRSPQQQQQHQQQPPSLTNGSSSTHKPDTDGVAQAVVNIKQESTSSPPPPPPPPISNGTNGQQLQQMSFQNGYPQINGHGHYQSNQPVLNTSNNKTSQSTGNSTNQGSGSNPPSNGTCGVMMFDMRNGEHQVGQNSHARRLTQDWQGSYPSPSPFDTNGSLLNSSQPSADPCKYSFSFF